MPAHLFNTPVSGLLRIGFKFSLFFLIALLLSLSACKKQEKEKEDTRPLVETTSVVPITPSKVTLTGNLISDGKVKVLDHGFEYDHSFHFDTPRKKTVSLGASEKSGEFTTIVEGLNPGHEGATRDDFFVRAYYTNAQGTVYGKPINIKLPRLFPKSLTPIEGKAGDKVTIKGDLFLTASKEIKVFFENQEAKLVSSSDREVVVEVPSTISLRHKEPVRVDLHIDGQIVTVGSTFIILASFQDFSPKSGPFNTELSFTGLNLPAGFSTKDNIEISVGGVESWLTSGEQFTARVQEGKNIKNKVAVTVNGVSVLLPGEFTVTPPVISSMSPLTAFAGEQVVLKGSNFPLPTSLAYGIMNFGNVSTSAQLYEGDVTAGIPYQLDPGTYTVSFTTGPFTVTAPQKLTVKPYQMISFAPLSGFPLTEIRIKGTFNRFQTYFVHFGTRKELGEAISNSELVVKVPVADNGTTLQPVVEMLGGQKFTVPGTFTLKGPLITSVSPISGGPGTQVTIHGANFRPQFGGEIDFGNGYYAPLDEITETTIKFTIPRISTPGSNKLRLAINGQNAFSPSNFTVTN